MRTKLIYYVGQKVIQEWIFISKSLAYWQKSKLLSSGQYNTGKFKIVEIK
jgi:hypothetical protein